MVFRSADIKLQIKNSLSPEYGIFLPQDMLVISLDLKDYVL
jgi:hypothetical protein